LSCIEIASNALKVLLSFVFIVFSLGVQLVQQFFQQPNLPLFGTNDCGVGFGLCHDFGHLLLHALGHLGWLSFALHGGDGGALVAGRNTVNALGFKAAVIDAHAVASLLQRLVGHLCPALPQAVNFVGLAKLPAHGVGDQIKLAHLVAQLVPFHTIGRNEDVGVVVTVVTLLVGHVKRYVCGHVVGVCNLAGQTQRQLLALTG
jgi:hypothetical protein